MRSARCKIKLQHLTPASRKKEDAQRCQMLQKTDNQDAGSRSTAYRTDRRPREQMREMIRSIPGDKSRGPQLGHHTLP